jgi:cytochrome c5
VSFNSVLKLFLAITAVILSVVTFAAVKDEIAARIGPVGDLCMSGDDCAAAPVAVATGPRSAEDIYNTKCMSCHATGAAGAPKLGDAGGWAPRIGKGVDVLYASAISGFNGMPAKGLCLDCSDDEIKATVDYMVENSQ